MSIVSHRESVVDGDLLIPGTNWRVEWLIGPAFVMGALTVQSDETYLCAPTTLQHVVAECLQFTEYFSHQIRIRYQRKKNELSRALQSAGFGVLPSTGAIYLMAAYDESRYASNLDAAKGLIEDFGMAAVPGNEFFDGPMNSGLFRFCFWVEQKLINAACERLSRRSSIGHGRVAVTKTVASRG